MYILAKEGILKTSQMLNVFSHFGICSFVQISRNLGAFASFEKYAIFWERSLLQLRNFSTIRIILSTVHKKSFIYFALFVPERTKMNAS